MHTFAWDNGAFGIRIHHHGSWEGDAILTLKTSKEDWLEMRVPIDLLVEAASKKYRRINGSFNDPEMGKFEYKVRPSKKCTIEFVKESPVGDDEKTLELDFDAVKDFAAAKIQFDLQDELESMSTQDLLDLGPSERRVLVFEEKHHTYHYYAPTISMRNAVCLQVLKRRVEEGFWYHEPKEPECPEFLQVNKEAVVICKKPGTWDQLSDNDLRVIDELIKLISPSFHKLAERRMVQFKNSTNAYIEDKHNWDLIQKAINDNDGNAAYKVLSARSDYEYEKMREEYAEVVNV